VPFEQSPRFGRYHRLLIIFVRKNFHGVECFESQERNKFHFVVFRFTDEYFRALVAGNTAFCDFEQNFFTQKLFVFLRIFARGPAVPNTRDRNYIPII
jgi:hypothetical protein